MGLVHAWTMGVIVARTAAWRLGDDEDDQKVKSVFRRAKESLTVIVALSES
jgi:hypothetical protein